MPDRPQVVLSGFGDEAANHKTAVEQFAAFAALGLQYYSLRFVDVGSGVKNVMKLTKTEITKLRHLEDEYGMNVASIGSPIGKVKLRDVEDGTKNRFVPFDKYLDEGSEPRLRAGPCVRDQADPRLFVLSPQGHRPVGARLPRRPISSAQIAEACHRSDLTFGLEIEANLVGQTGELMAELHRRVNHPALVTIFDGGNIVSQGYGTEETFQQYLAMKPSIGWMHIKDYHDPQLDRPQRARRRRQAQALRAGGPGRQRPRANPARLCRSDSAARAEAHASAAFRASFSTWSRISRAAANSAASAAPTAWASPCAACAACSTTSASTTTCATSTTSAPHAASETVQS